MARRRRFASLPSLKLFPLCRLSRGDPHFAIGDSELVHEEWPNYCHSVAALFALPECSHVLVALPLRDRIPRVGIILIAKEPLIFQSFRFSANFKSLSEGCFERIPLAGENFAPNDPHMHFDISRNTVLATFDGSTHRAFTSGQPAGLQAPDYP